MADKKIKFKDIWETLRAVDTSKIVTKKGGLDYINWADAWACIMEHYPEAIYDFPEPTFYGAEDNKTCEVYCRVTIGEFTRECFLPVMQSMMPMKSIPNPTSRDIHDAKQRCLVKAFAIFGFGLHLWEKRDNQPGKPRDISSDPF